MIPARKNRFFNAWFAGHARGRVEGTFGEVRVFGLDGARAAAMEAPLLVVSNHTSWWDPLVALYVTNHLMRADAYAMMDAKNLRKLPFFGLVGGFGVDLDQPADGMASIRYAAKLLARPGKLVWVFPQGRERPVTERPLGFRRGAAEIARIARCARTLPIAIRYEFGSRERPDLYLSFGEPLDAERDAERGREMIERAVTLELDRIEKAIGGDEGAPRFEVIFRAKTPFLGTIAEKILALFTRHWAIPSSLPAAKDRNDPR